MPDVHITDLASIGVWQDVPPWQLPPEAFSLGTNVRIKGDGVQRMPGWSAKWSDLITETPQFLFPVRSSSGDTYWIYCTDTKILVVDGATQTDLSGATYSGTQWQSTLLGGVPILNNGVEKPQFWDLNLANNFGDLTGFPATAVAKTIKAFGPYLVGINWTIGGTRYPHMVKWSHPADPGTIPSSWDETDPTVDAGQIDLADVDAGECLDMLPMRGANVIYKENSTWLQRPTGGGLIFQFDQFLSSVGILAARCVALTGDGKYHFVVTGDDIIVHDGVSTPVSILDRRMRRAIFEQIDTTYHHNCFVFANAPQTEMWFCYPTLGNEFPNKALVWQYGAGSALGVLYEADIAWRHAATGDIAEDSEFWDSATATWDEAVGFWNNNLRRRVLAVDGAGLKFFLLDDGLTRDGSNFASTLTREGLAIIGRRRSGEPIVDWRNRKFCRRIWPTMSGAPINIRLGAQRLPDGSITWQSPQSFNPAVDRYLDVTAVGEGIAIEFSSSVAGDWKLHGYTLELQGGGRH